MRLKDVIIELQYQDSLEFFSPDNNEKKSLTGSYIKVYLLPRLVLTAPPAAEQLYVHCC